MLIRFTTENILCFKDETALSLVASTDDRHVEHVYPSKSKKKPRLLRASAIYGANGHGKTRLVEAIDLLRTIVVIGTEGDEQIRYSNFKLDVESRAKPSKLVIEFRIDQDDYEYGITFFSTHICEEWLFCVDKSGRESSIFERVTSITADGGHDNEFKFGSRLKKSTSPSKNVTMALFLEVVASGTRRNQPFIRESIDRNIGVLRPVYEWFRDVLAPVHADAFYGKLFERARTEKKFADLLSNYIHNADVGIEKMIVDEVSVDTGLPSALPSHVMDQINEGLDKNRTVEVGTRDGSVLIFNRDEKGNTIATRIASVRRDSAGNEVAFSMDEESSGTRRLLDMIPMLYADGRTRVFVVDELDRKLHPIMARKFIETFLSGSQNQLIYTTHNTYLLDLDLLRRDEIWFVQKKDDGSSELYSLSDLKVRPDLDVRRGYLNGRFGAVPFAGNILDLGWSAEVQEVENAVH